MKSVVTTLLFLLATSIMSCAQDIAALESKIAKNPSDVDLRIEAIEAYFEEEIRNRQGSSTATNKKMIHVNWMIQNHPEHPYSGSPAMQDITLPGEINEQLAALWRKQVASHGTNAMVLRNAARCLREPGNVNETLSLLERAHKIDPGNPAIIGDLAENLALSNPDLNGRKRIFELRQKEFELQTEGSSKFYALTDLAESAVAAGDLKAGRSYAQQLLNTAEAFKDDWNYGNAIYTGHVVLGEVALQSGDVDKAAAELVLAGKTPGSPQLNSFGPELRFANEVLKKGKRSEVLQFLKDLQKFWELDYGRLAAWQKQIENGETPVLDRFAKN
jgi:hypothetical protein